MENTFHSNWCHPLKIKVIQVYMTGLVVFTTQPFGNIINFTGIGHNKFKLR